MNLDSWSLNDSYQRQGIDGCAMFFDQNFNQFVESILAGEMKRRQSQFWLRIDECFVH